MNIVMFHPAVFDIIRVVCGHDHRWKATTTSDDLVTGLFFGTTEKELYAQVYYHITQYLS